MGAMVTARHRLVFDEVFRIQLSLVRRKREIERSATGIGHAVGADVGVDPGLVDRFVASLPFRLTDTQRAAIDEIDADLASAVPMHRLLQGDVGSGKTVVALAALLTAVQGGFQGAFMAPTEVLADQHAASVRALLDGLGSTGDAGAGRDLFGTPLEAAVLTNRTTAAERRRVLSRDRRRLASTCSSGPTHCWRNPSCSSRSASS